jgi:hypothetical protein
MWRSLERTERFGNGSCSCSGTKNLFLQKSERYEIVFIFIVWPLVVNFKKTIENVKNKNYSKQQRLFKN